MIKLTAQMIETGDTIVLGSTAREVLGVYKSKDLVRIVYQADQKPRSISRYSTDRIRVQ